MQDNFESQEDYSRYLRIIDALEIKVETAYEDGDT